MGEKGQFGKLTITCKICLNFVTSVGQAGEDGKEKESYWLVLLHLNVMTVHH